MNIQDSVNAALGSAANAVQTNKIIQGQELESNLRKIQVQETATNQRNDITNSKNDLEDLTRVENFLAGNVTKAKEEADNFKGKKVTKKGKATKKYQTLIDAAVKAENKLNEVIEMKRDLKLKLQDRISVFNARAEAYTKAGIKVDKIEEVK